MPFFFSLMGVHGSILSDHACKCVCVRGGECVCLCERVCPAYLWVGLCMCTCVYVLESILTNIHSLDTLKIHYVRLPVASQRWPTRGSDQHCTVPSRMQSSADQTAQAPSRQIWSEPGSEHDHKKSPVNSSTLAWLQDYKSSILKIFSCTF